MDSKTLESIKRSYEDDKMPIVTLSLKHKTSKKTMRGILKSMGVRIKGCSEGKKITPPPREKLQKLYKECGNQKGVANELGVSQRMVSIWMINYNLPRKSNRGEGPNAPNWKGGTRKTSSGRTKKWCPDHPRADGGGCVYNQILVWEKANGIIPKGHVIHHINGIPDDDRLENLALMKKSEHHGFLPMWIKEKKIEELEKENMELRKRINNVR